MIYFDNAASTLVDEEILNSFISDTKEFYSNPSANHFLGLDLRYKIDNDKRDILKFLNLSFKDYDCIFTSGATEANNLIIQGICKSYKTRGNKIITSKVEHSSVLNVFRALEEEGFCVSYIPLKNNKLDLDVLKKELNNDVILVSFIGLNNETGLILNLKEVKDILKNYPKVIFHSDVCQMIGKSTFDFKLFDLLTLSSYKEHGIKGIGAVIKKRNIQLKPLFFGGGHQDNLRSGTMNYPLIHSMRNTLEKAIKETQKSKEIVKEIYNYIYSELDKMKDDVVLNSLPLTYQEQSPFILNFSLLKRRASNLVEALSLKKVYVSTKSSCSSKIKGVSHVVLELTHDEFLSENSIRLSFSKFNTLDEAYEFIKIFKEELYKLKEVR